MEGAFRDPGIPDGEESRYRGLIDGEEAGQGTLRIEHEGDRAYRQRISMRAFDEAEYELDARFARRRGAIVAESYRLETRHAGRLAAVEEGHFRDVKALWFGGTLQSYPRDMSPLLGCAVVLRGLEFEPGARRTFPVWLANSVHWDVETHVEHVEEVDVPAGRRPGWRVRVRPSFARVAGRLDALVALLLPPFTLHFEAEPTHRLLRFSFPTGPFRWNPRGLIEAIELP